MLGSATFDDVPTTPKGHLSLALYETAYRLVYHISGCAAGSERGLDAVLDEFPFLALCFGEIRPRLPKEISWDESLVWLRRQIENWEEAVTDWLPLRELRLSLGLSPAAVQVLLLAGFVEESGSFGDLFAKLQPNGTRRPTTELIGALHSGFAAAVPLDGWALCRPLIEYDLLQILNPDDPRSEWQVRVPPPVWNAVRGEPETEPAPGVRLYPRESLTRVSELILPDDQRRRVAEIVNTMGGSRTRMLNIRGLAGAERLEMAGAVARGIGRNVLAIEGHAGDVSKLHTLGALCTLTRSMPVFSLDLTPGETFQIPELRGYTGPCGVVMGLEGGVAGRHSEQAVSIQLEPEAEDSRLLYWRRYLGPHRSQELPEIARTFAIPGGHIRRCAELAAANAAIDGRDGVTLEDVRVAARSINRELMDSLATRLEPGGGWSRMVVKKATRDSLFNLERRCRHRERLASSVGEGFPGGLNRGVRALFEGPSGTGKTLAARTLAGELKLDVYRVDLAAVVNKYIGETEKNLSRVLSHAEDLNLLLLLDEGDSLMTRRTDVKSANDRYANLETNYLLQRLDTYTGILVVTTNAGSYIDSAFRRRMDVLVGFHLPDAEERWQLWSLHLPRDHRVDAATLEEIALRYPFTGGQIRNAAIHASLLAIDSGRSGLVDSGRLLAAIQVEHRKAGATCPGLEPERRCAAAGSLTSFLGAIS